MKNFESSESSECDDYVVSGRVTYSSGRAAAGLIVRARDHDLRRFESLGKETTTRTDGSYEIRYTRSNFVRAEKDRADLVVRVFSPEQPDPDKALVESAILFNAPPHAEVDLQIPDSALTRSEFERHLDVILPLLASQNTDGSDLTMTQLTDDDLDFLTGETGIERQHIAWLKLAFEYAAKLATTSARLATQKSATHLPVSPALFYGWFREGISDKWDVLVQQSISILRAAARAAIRDGVIPAELESTIGSALDHLPNSARDDIRNFATAVGLNETTLETVLQNSSTVAELNNAT